jgi:hypothetical protein
MVPDPRSRPCSADLLYRLAEAISDRADSLRLKLPSSALAPACGPDYVIEQIVHPVIGAA